MTYSFKLKKTEGGELTKQVKVFFDFFPNQ